MTSDRRQHNRIDVPAGLIANDGFWAVNLSETGMAFSSRIGFEPAAIIEIILALPSHKQRTSARVVWSKRALSNAKGEFLIGVTFVELSRATQRAIKAYIAENSEPTVCVDSAVGSSG